MAFSAERWKKNYQDGASGAGSKLVEGYKDAPNKLARATSEAAQANYKAAMSDPKVLERRVKNLKKLTEEDLNRAMDAKGATAYTTGVNAAVDKAASGFAPYGAEQDRIVAGLKPKTRDPMANVDNRVKPFVKGMVELKEKQG